MSGTLQYTVSGGIARLVLDQPARLNAISLAMWQAIPGWISQAAADKAVRLIVLEGQGDQAFSAGADISRFADERQGAPGVAAYDQAVAAAEAAVERAPKPTLALVQGICFGGGLGLASACDLRLANASARFRIPAARLGIGYAPAGIVRMARLVGPAVTADLLFAATMLSAPDAAMAGLVNKVFPDAQFTALALAYAQTIASHAPLSLAAAKLTLQQLAVPEAKRDFSQAQAVVAACYASSDYAEGQRAFAQKRMPLFNGE